MHNLKTLNVKRTKITDDRAIACFNVGWVESSRPTDYQSTYGGPRRLNPPDILPDLNKALALAGSALTDRGLANLGNLPSLIHLDVRWSKVTDQGLVQLRELPFLRTLYLENCVGITDEGAAILATMHGLESLNVSRTSISREGVLRVATLPRLRCLHETYYGPEMRVKLQRTLPAGCKLNH